MLSKDRNRLLKLQTKQQLQKNLGSNSKEKLTLGKYRSQKAGQISSRSKSKQHSRKASRVGKQQCKDNKLIKPERQDFFSDEYYRQVKKSKSKSKRNGITTEEEINTKRSYFGSVYMHKQDQLNSNEILQNSFQNIIEKCFPPCNSNLKMIKRIKMVQKQAVIDNDGKLVQKQIKKNIQKKLEPQNSHFSTTSNVKLSSGYIIKAESKKQLSSIRNLKEKKVKLKNMESEKQIISQKKQRIKSILKTKNQAQLFQTTLKTIQSAQTQSSPNLMKNPIMSPILQAEIISFEDLIEEITEDKRHFKNKKFKIKNQQYLLERTHSIDFMGKLCSQLFIRRQVHSLAIIYLDLYIDSIISSILKKKQIKSQSLNIQQAVNFPLLIKNLKLFSLTCLMVALKMQDGLMARRFCHQIKTNIEGLLKKHSKTSQKMKQCIANLQGYHATSITRQSKIDNNYSLSKTKMNLSSLTSARSLDHVDPKDIKRARKDDDIDLNKMIKIETDLLQRFHFNLKIKSSHYWLDILTLKWDKYAFQETQWPETLCFRDQHSTSNISYLMQVAEKSFLSLDVYGFQTSTLILAIIYLIVRLKLEQQKQLTNIKDLFEKYRMSLLKSTNVIFCDNVGINQLYGNFLTLMNLNLSDIVSAVKFVGQFFTEDCLKQFNFNRKPKDSNSTYQSHEYRLSLYQYNSQIYNSYCYK